MNPPPSTPSLSAECLGNRFNHPRRPPPWMESVGRPRPFVSSSFASHPIPMHDGELDKKPHPQTRGPTLKTFSGHLSRDRAHRIRRADEINSGSTTRCPQNPLVDTTRMGLSEPGVSFQSGKVKFRKCCAFMWRTSPKLPRSYLPSKAFRVLHEAKGDPSEEFPPKCGKRKPS